LRVVPHHDEFIVGDPAAGDVVVIPEMGVAMIHALEEGATIDEAGDLASLRTGVDVDAVDFATTLLALGFVSGVNGRHVCSARDRRRDGGRIGQWLAPVAAPLFSPAAWMVYGVLFASCLAALLSERWLRPHGRDLLFLHNPVASVGCMFVVGVAFGAAHEGAHWLAARVQGIPASFSISRRFYFFVLQTDLTGIWTLPRARRLSPILAGMAFDTVRLSSLLALRVAIHAGVWHPPVLLARLITALAASTVVAIAFQFFVFLRTDLYAAAVTWLGCVNLTRVTRLLIVSALRGLSVAEREELGDAGARDVRVARWYRWLYLAGVVAAGWFLVAFFGPNVVTIVHWTLADLDRDSPSHPAFWGTLLLGALALAPVALAALVVVRDHTRDTRATG
jgi:hypothetical protein